MKKAKKSSIPKREMRPRVLDETLRCKVNKHIEASGEVNLACAPSLVAHNVKALNTIFGQLGHPFADAELEALMKAVQKHAEEGFRESPYSRVVVQYNTKPPPHPGIEYEVTTFISTIADEYEKWVATRAPPLFGKNPDAKVMRLAAELGAPSDVPILDVGAGTGRNTFPLAKLGYPTSALEIAPALAAVMREIAKNEAYDVEILEGDVLDPAFELPSAKYKLVVLAEVVASHFRDPSELRKLAERASEILAPGGIMLFSAFTAVDGYKPKKQAREFSQVVWCTVFTRRELAKAIKGLPLELVSEESVHDYEHEHLPAEAWPPTGWFVNWTQGSDLFVLPAGTAPIEMRWFSWQRK